MGQVLHGSARTTEAVRRAIQRSFSTQSVESGRGRFGWKTDIDPKPSVRGEARTAKAAGLLLSSIREIRSRIPNIGPGAVAVLSHCHQRRVISARLPGIASKLGGSRGPGKRCQPLRRAP